MAFKKPFIISDESVNSYGFVVKTAGIRLEKARKNCPAFYSHRTFELPLGHWENFRVENSKLVGDLIIEGANELEKEYIRKIENGDIKGASIGADPLAWNSDAAQLTTGQTRPTLIDCELFEVSITALPGNKNSLCLKRPDGVITLTDENVNSFIPLLKTEHDMKAIALKLGLSETATENDILTAIGTVQLAKTNAEAFNASVLAEAEKDLTPEQKEIFVTLSKANPAQALAYVKLSTPVMATLESTVDKKGATIVNLIKAGKQANGDAVSEDAKDSFDYLQKKNPVELARIHKEDPTKYAQLAAEYGKGVRYTGK